MADSEPERSPASSLVHEIGRAAQAGWAQTARLSVLLLAIAAAAVVLIVVTSRY